MQGWWRGGLDQSRYAGSGAAFPPPSLGQAHVAVEVVGPVACAGEAALGSKRSRQFAEQRLRCLWLGSRDFIEADGEQAGQMRPLIRNSLPLNL